MDDMVFLLKSIELGSLFLGYIIGAFSVTVLFFFGRTYQSKDSEEHQWELLKKKAFEDLKKETSNTEQNNSIQKVKPPMSSTWKNVKKSKRIIDKYSKQRPIPPSSKM